MYGQGSRRKQDPLGLGRLKSVISFHQQIFSIVIISTYAELLNDQHLQFEQDEFTAAILDELTDRKNEICTPNVESCHLLSITVLIKGISNDKAGKILAQGMFCNGVKEDRSHLPKEHPSIVEVKPSGTHGVFYTIVTNGVTEAADWSPNHVQEIEFHFSHLSLRNNNPHYFTVIIEAERSPRGNLELTRRRPRLSNVTDQKTIAVSSL